MIYEIDSEGEGLYENKLKDGNNNGNPAKNSQFNVNNQYKDEDKSNDFKIIGEKDFKLLSTKNLLGKISFLRWKMRKNFLFGLDMQKGHILCYKNTESKKQSTYYTIIRGQFINDEQTQEDSTLIKVKSRKGKLFTMKLFEDKDPQTIKEYLQNCFDKKIATDDPADKQLKGFFAMLGKGMVSIFKVPFRISSGILVTDQIQDQQVNKMAPNKIFTEEKQNKKQDKHIPVSGMFFGTSQIVKEILGSIAVLHGGYQEAQSCFSLSQDISSGDSQCAVALIFKPIQGTIDMVIMKMSNGDLLLERDLYQDIFKVRRIRKSKKKLKKKQIQAEKDRQLMEFQLGIDDTKMEQVTKNDSEILYLKKDNGLLLKSDIEKMHKWGQVINLGDIDQTKKRDEDPQAEQEIINELLDFYKKKKLEVGSPEEEICEFMIAFPFQTDEAKNIVENIGDHEEADFWEVDNMEEMIGEDTVVNMERYQERYEHKCLPRVHKKPVQGNEHNNDNFIFKVTDGQMPAFHVSQSPFSKQKGDEYMADLDNIEMNQQQQNGKQYSNNNSPKQIKQFEEDKLYETPSQQNKNQEYQLENIQRNDNQQQEEQEIQTKQPQNNNNNQLPLSNNNNTNGNLLQVHQNGQQQQQNNSSNQGSQRNIQQQPEGIKEQLENEEESSSESEDDFGEGDDAIVKATSDYEHVKMTGAEIIQWIHNFKKFPQLKDEDRIKEAHKNGGKVCNNKEIISTMRGVGKFILGQIGRKILSGDFNLTTVSFPIKAMIPKSALQTSLYGTVLFPYYMGLASQSNDFIERFKFLIVASLGNFPIANGFLKPLNPILGETFEGSYPDGTHVYAEQTSHHPPVTSFLTVGPNKSYTQSGYYLFDANAGFNSLTLKNRGKRSVVFHSDGQEINYNFGHEYYSGTFMGTMKHESLGTMEFVDEKNNIKAQIVVGKVKKKPSDYIAGEITLNGNLVSRCTGSYNGFIEFDGIRYWDHRYVKPFKCNVIDNGLQSDHSLRPDRLQLAKGNIGKAQKEKEKLENLQRQDKKNRKAQTEIKQKQEKKAMKDQKKADKQAKKNK